jgi:transcription initiation factor TFIIIB Brf1 subunit/transcription initiation factor TFIIB
MNQSNEVGTNLPPGLSAIAGNRDLITTPEVAQVFNVASQTIRKNYSLTGEAYGIRPTKIGNRLLWSVAQIAEKLRGAI